MPARCRCALVCSGDGGLLSVDNGHCRDDGWLMPLFEFAFEVPAIDESVEDAIAETLDAVIAWHSGVTTVSVVQAGVDCVAAAREVVEQLRAVGAPPRRLVDDLVTRAQIAERAGVTRQAVSAWTRGERGGEAAFPAPYVLVGGGLWLWGEVSSVLASRGVLEDEGVVYPSRQDAQVIGGVLAADSAPSGAWLLMGSAGWHFSVTDGAEVAQKPVGVPPLKRTDFAQAA